ncbi:hypothetical protein Fot_18090 [Forsythia ovata]|uniref:Uncharacterized protein n=1 Tax=Forsythia ovata TaxID=205694 RepID=A0ABD1VH65_9LAMI
MLPALLVSLLQSANNWLRHLQVNHPDRAIDYSNLAQMDTGPTLSFGGKAWTRIVSGGGACFGVGVINWRWVRGLCGGCCSDCGILKENPETNTNKSSWIAAEVPPTVSLPLALLVLVSRVVGEAAVVTIWVESAANSKSPIGCFFSTAWRLVEVAFVVTKCGCGH